MWHHNSQYHSNYVKKCELTLHSWQLLAVEGCCTSYQRIASNSHLLPRDKHTMDTKYKKHSLTNPLENNWHSQDKYSQQHRINGVWLLTRWSNCSSIWPNDKQSPTGWQWQIRTMGLYWDCGMQWPSNYHLLRVLCWQTASQYWQQHWLLLAASHHNPNPHQQFILDIIPVINKGGANTKRSSCAWI